MTTLITGANRGIGRALLNAYKADGRRAFGTARNAPDLLPLEVTDSQSQSELAQHVAGFGIDTLICNAGVYLDKGQKIDTGFDPALWDESFQVNVTGVFLTVQALLPILENAAAPKIAIFSSQMASHQRAPGGSYIYRASKAAALNLGRNLATDLRPRGVAVGIYHPGWVKTDMGGPSAEITADQAAQGLIERIDQLTLETSGVFETWDGHPHPY